MKNIQPFSATFHSVRFRAAEQPVFHFFTQVFLARNFKLRYNEDAEGSCQSESEAKICTEILTGTR